MTAGIDSTNGVASFAAAREGGWHKLGVTVPEEMTATQALEYAHLSGWNVRKEPMYTASGLLVPDQFAVIRDNPIVKEQVDILGTAGNIYHVLQNEETAELLDYLVDDSGAHYDTAGALDGGRRVFLTMKLPGNMQIGGKDRIDTYLAITNSHDGSSSVSCFPTPVRVVCKNTLNVALAGASSIIKVRHTKGAAATIRREARQVLDLSFKYLDGFQKEAEILINTTLTQNRFEEIINKEFGAPEGSAAGTVTRSNNKIDKMAELFSDAYTQEGIRGTAWAGFNAITEWVDHFSPVRSHGGDDDTVRAERAVLSPSAKSNALQLMLAEVK